jgi:hypothetical protein
MSMFYKTAEKAIEASKISGLSTACEWSADNLNALDSLASSKIKHLNGDVYCVRGDWAVQLRNEVKNSGKPIRKRRTALEVKSDTLIDAIVREVHNNRQL